MPHITWDQQFHTRQPIKVSLEIPRTLDPKLMPQKIEMVVYIKHVFWYIMLFRPPISCNLNSVFVL